MSEIYKGIVVEVESAQVVKVWIPAKHATPLGQWEYLGHNVGGNIRDEEVKKTAIRCRIMSPLANGAWWTYIPDEGASIPGNPINADASDVMDYALFPEAKPLRQTITGSLQSKSNLPAQNLSPVHPVLGQAGGIPIPSTSHIPPGSFPKVTPNQHVLVAFVKCSMPIIIGTLPTDLEIQATLGN